MTAVTDAPPFISRSIFSFKGCRMTHPIHTLIAGAAALSFAFSGSAYAQQQKPTPVPTTQVAAESVELTGPALWKVADEDTTIYLFGTVHALPEGLNWYTPAIEDALASSDTIVTEIPSGPETQARMQQLIMSKAILPEGTTLRGMLNEEQKSMYEGAMAKLGLPAEAFDRFEPWMAGLTLTMLPLLKEGYLPEQGVETRLEKLAGADKTRGALETMEFQIGIFDGFSEEDQVGFLMATAESVDEIKPMLDAMVAEWLEGDADALAKLMNEGLDDPEVAEALLYDRNANWAEWIDARLDSPGTIFMAVGAGHLAGEKSVQDLLDKRGIESIRVQ